VAELVKTCEQCGGEMSRRQGENSSQFGQRRFCSLTCYWESAADRYQELLHLIQWCGAEPRDALARCGINARSAMRYAHRHGLSELLEAVRPAYRYEQALWARNRRKVSA